jgi:hypothetical protein
MEPQTYQTDTLELERELMYEGFDRLQEAIQNYKDEPTKDPTDVPEFEGGTAKEPLVEFLGACLTKRQAEVVEKVNGHSSDICPGDFRLWTKIRASVLKHPAVVSGVVEIEKQTNKETKSETAQQPVAGIETVLFEAMNEPIWKKKAACRGDTRFVSPGIKSPAMKLDLLKICAECPVYGNCLDYVDEKSPETGIWAGVLRVKDSKDNDRAGYHEDGNPKTIQEMRPVLRDLANTNPEPE